METVVQVTTLEEWKAVLDVWFKQGYDWASYSSMRNDYREEFYWGGSRQLGFNVHGGREISYWSLNDYTGDNLIEYSDFMAQQKEGNKMETYYITREQYDLIEELKRKTFPIDFLILNSDGYFKPLTLLLTPDEAKALLRHLGGDETIEFKVKEILYQLWRTNTSGDPVYMRFSKSGNPDWTIEEDKAFTAPLEEIKKHKTISWEIEEVPPF